MKRAKHGRGEEQIRHGSHAQRSGALPALPDKTAAWSGKRPGQNKSEWRDSDGRLFQQPPRRRRALGTGQWNNRD